MANYNEATNGDLSGNSSSPTNITLSPGNNVISGTTTGNPSLDRDFFTFEVPVGSTVSAIILENYQWGDGNQSTASYGDSYFAVIKGSSFPSLADDSTFEISKLIDDYTAEASEEGQDLLEPGVGKPSSGKAGTGQLVPGTYSVWFQETGANTTYAFNVVLNTPQPGVIQFSSSAFQANEAAGTVNITLTRTDGSDGAVSVDLSRTGGTAENASDFNFSSTTVNFAAGETQKTVSVAIVNDTAVEGNETVAFELSNPTGGATLGTAKTSTLTITDDESATTSTIQFSSGDIQVNEAAGTVDITLTRSGNGSGAASVNLSQPSGTAQNSSDFNFTSTTVNFAAGETQKTVSVAIVNDTLVEGNETATFELSNPTGATLGTIKTSTLTITDDDQLNVVNGTDEPDTLAGGPKNDRILGLKGDDRLSGRNGNDQLLGNQGDDRLLGGNGDDFLDGGRGDDFLDGGKGADTLIGRGGNDSFALKRGNGADFIRDFQLDKDTLNLRGNLRFRQLTITQDGDRAVISVGSEQLATLRGIEAEQLTANQFT